MGSLVFLVAFFTLTPVHDDYGSFISGMANGQFSDFSFIDLHYMGFIGVNRGYKLLYFLFPGYDWLGTASLFFSFVGLLLLLHSIRTVVLKNCPELFLVRVAQLLLALFYLENVLVVSHTRFSLLFCGLALVNLLFSETLKKRQLLFWSLFFLLGMLHRPESSVGMLVLVSAGFLVYRFRPGFLLKRIWFPLLATTVLFSVITVDRLQTDMYIRRVEPEIEYKLMDKRVVDASEMKTPADSVKYEAALMGMWFDTQTLTPEYLRSILLPGVNLGGEHALQVLVHITGFYGRYPFIPVCVLFLAVLVGYRQETRAAFRKLLLWQLVTFGILYGLDFNGLLVDGRHFLNLQLISMLITLYYAADAWARLTRLRGWVWAGGLLLLFLADGLTLTHYVATNRMVMQSVRCYESFMEETERTYNGRIVVLTLDNYNLLDHPFTFREKKYTGNTYLMYDLFTFSLIPEYVAYLDRMCGCRASDPVAFYRWLASREALYIAKPRRYNLTERYMRIIHGQKLAFVPDNRLADMPCTKISHKKGFEVLKVTEIP